MKDEMSEQLELPMGDLVLKWKYVAYAALLFWPLIGGLGFLGNAYWENLKGENIGDGTVNLYSQIGDSVLLIYKDMGNYVGTYEFVISEENLLGDDYIKTIPASETFNHSGHLAAKWEISHYDFGLGEDGGDAEFYFTINTNDSNILNVNDSYYFNSKPNVGIIKPTINSKFTTNVLINFTQFAWDEDDDLKIKWIYEDGSDSGWMLNCLTTNNCNTTNIYDNSGTKVISVIAKEMNRVQQDSEDTRVFIYDEGINVFSVITQPPFGKIYPGGIQLVPFNASGTYVAECDVDEGICDVNIAEKYETSSGNYCNNIGDSDNPLWCYDIPNLDDSDATGKYTLEFIWEFSENIGISGFWDGDYLKVVEFSRIFYAPVKHWARLIVDYTGLP